MLPMTSFLKLPAEIRNQVYSLVAADEGPCQVNPILVHIGIESGPNLPKPINLTRNDERLQHGTATGTSNNGLDALLHTTRTIREECLSFLLHQNVITTHSSIGDLIDALGKPARHLRRLILLQQRCHSMSVPPKSSSTNLLHACSTIQAQLPKLERLDIAVENNAAGEQEVFVWASHHRLPTRLEPSSVERQCNAAEHIAVSLHKRTFDKLTHGILGQPGGRYGRSLRRRMLNLRAEEKIISGQEQRVWKGMFSDVECGSLACVAWDELKMMVLEAGT